MKNYQPVFIEGLFEEHFDEASWLWEMRDRSVDSPLCTLNALADLDERIEAHLDGLRLAGDAAWTLCEEKLEEDEPGTLFTAAIIAFEGHDFSRMRKIASTGAGAPGGFRALSSALGWMNDRRFSEIILPLSESESIELRRLAYAACGLRRLDPRAYLEKAIVDEDPQLTAIGLKVAGALKRKDLLPAARKHLENEDHACRFEAARSARLLGDTSVQGVLTAFTGSWSRFTMPALEILMRTVPRETGASLVRALYKEGKHRESMFAIAASGDAGYIVPLLKQMEEPESSRAAACAISMITGLDLARESLEVEQPEDFESGPNDDPEDENVAMDPDQDLPWPDIVGVNRWWNEHGGEYTPGTRYLAGEAVSPESCRRVLETGNQLERQAAALELALANPDTTLFNTQAPAGWQCQQLRKA